MFILRNSNTFLLTRFVALSAVEIFHFKCLQDVSKEHFSYVNQELFWTSSYLMDPAICLKCLKFSWITTLMSFLVGQCHMLTLLLIKIIITLLLIYMMHEFNEHNWTYSVESTTPVEWINFFWSITNTFFLINSIIK